MTKKKLICVVLSGALGIIAGVGTAYVGVLKWDIEQTVSYGCGYLAGMEEAGYKFDSKTSATCRLKQMKAHEYGFNPK